MTGGEDFRCGRCGACCRWPGHVYLTGEDAASLARELRLPDREFADRYARLAPNRAGLVLALREDGACVFLEGDLCAVHAARPKQCRDFPHAWRVEGACPDRPPEKPRPGGDGANA